MDNPQKGTGTPISWREIHTVWYGEVDKCIPERHAAQATTFNGKSVPVKLKESTRASHLRNFERIRKGVAKEGLDDNSIPILRDASKVMAFFRLIEVKTPLGIEQDWTVQDKAEGAVVGRADDDDDEINSRTISKAANFVRACDKSLEPKNVIMFYPNRIGTIVAT